MDENFFDSSRLNNEQLKILEDFHSKRMLFDNFLVQHKIELLLARVVPILLCLKEKVMKFAVYVIGKTMARIILMRMKFAEDQIINFP